jgi:hypothetical protein
MRHCWLVALVAILPVVTCSCGRTDPRTRPGFVDTSNPKDAAKAMKESSPLSSKSKQTSKPGSKPGGS